MPSAASALLKHRQVRFTCDLTVPRTVSNIRPRCKLLVSDCDFRRMQKNKCNLIALHLRDLAKLRRPLRALSFGIWVT